MTVKEKYINPFTNFERLFETAEIAKFSPEEKEEYQESLKSYRDLKNVIDTSYEDGKIEGKIEGEIEAKTKGIINALKQGKLIIEDIAEIFSTTIDFVMKVKEEQNLCPPQYKAEKALKTFDFQGFLI